MAAGDICGVFCVWEVWECVDFDGVGLGGGVVEWWEYDFGYSFWVYAGSFDFESGVHG